MPRLSPLLAGLFAVALSASPADAQQTRSTNERFYLYDQFVPPGAAGQMHLVAGQLRPHVPQQVRITLPGEGTITFFDGSLSRPIDVAAPAQAAVHVGLMYRLKLSNIPNHPHVDFYPSIELISELHPPPGQAERFPIQIDFDDEELAWAAQGRLVTKVVYLEQPDRVPLRNLRDAPRVFDLQAGENAIAEADNLGRPIAIIRLGGRTPDPNLPDPQFWGPLAPVRIVERPEPAPAAQRKMPPAPQAPSLTATEAPTDNATEEAPSLEGPVSEPDAPPTPMPQRRRISLFPGAAPAPESSLR